MGNYVEVKSVGELEKVMKENNKVVLDAWAVWCGPCKMFAPVFESASVEVTDVKFVKVNVDEAADVAAKLSIMSIPTIVAVKDGNEVARKSGAMPKNEFKKWLDSNLK